MRKQVPNWNLTSDESMEFIRQSHLTKQEKERKKQRNILVSKQAIKEANKAEREQKKKK